MRYCVGYTIVWGFGTWQTSWTLASNGNTTAIFAAKLDWTKDEALLYNAIISSAAIVGATIGSLVGGYLLKLGRRRPVIIAQLVCIVASAIGMIPHTSTLTICRFLLGVGAGFQNVAFGKLVTETIPISVMSYFAMAHNASICVGLMVVFFLGSVLPDPDDLEANKQDEFWRIIWIFPAIIGLIEILLTLFVIRLEPINYCVMTGRDEEGKKHLRKVYRLKEPADSQKQEEIYSKKFMKLKGNTSMDAASVSFKEAVCDRKYRKATWVCFFINVFN